MRFVLILLILPFSQLLCAQVSVFTKLIEDSLVRKDSLCSIEKRIPSSDNVAPFQENMEEAQRCLASEIKGICSTRYGELSESQVLKQMSRFAVCAWKGSNYSDQSKWKELDRRFKRAKRQAVSGFNVIHCISFRVNLSKTASKRVYFDKELGTNDFNLFKGKKLTKKEVEEGKVPIEVPILTQAELIEECILKLKRRGVYGDLRQGVYSTIGISFQLDERTLFRNTKPTVRVVVFLGAKRLQRLRRSGSVAD